MHHRTPEPNPAREARPTHGCPRAHRLRAFTFVEVMVVAAILAILAVVVMPNILSATTPMPAPVGEALEADLRRARIESISRLEPIVVVVGASRDRWWIARATEPDEPLPGTGRVLGTGTLSPFIGHSLQIGLGVDAEDPQGNAIVARFDQFGSRDGGQVSFRLRRFGLDAEPTTIGSWTLEPQRTRLRAAATPLGAT